MLDLFFILHFTYLGGCVRTQRTPPPAYGPEVIAIVEQCDTIRYDTIRYAILVCSQKLTQVSLIYRTESLQLKSGKMKK